MTGTVATARIAVFLRMVVAASALSAAACSAPQQDTAMADLVLTNGRIYTLDEQNPWSTAVAVRGDTIVYVGSEEGAGALIGDATRRMDLAGRLLLPGFIDTHVHPFDGGGYINALSLDTEAGVDDWLRAIDDYADDNPQLDVVFGYGFLASAFGMTGPTRQELDAIVPDRPVLIVDEGLHGAWVNTAALRALNVTRDTQDPVPGYSYYKRDDRGDATGYLLEGTVTTAIDQLDVVSEEIVRAGTARVIDIMNGYGVTAAFDAGYLGDPALLRNVLAELAKRDELTLRLVGSSRAETAEDAASAVATAEQWRDTIKGERYHYNTLKIPDDGTVEGRTAAMFEDYQGEPGNSGSTVFTEQQLIDMMSGAAAIDMDVHVHALGERAIHETLNAIEATKSAHPGSRTRYTICHVQVISDQDLPRFAELGVIAQSTPLWAAYDAYGEKFVSPDQFNRFWRFRSLEDSGARLTFGSDFPSSGAGTVGLSPVVQIEIGHTRQYPGQPDAPVQPRATERLSVPSLVRGFTLDAAYQLRMEDRIGSIEVGKKADFVLLDRDLFEVAPHTIHTTRVLMTILGGQVVFAETGVSLSTSFDSSERLSNRPAAGD